MRKSGQGAIELNCAQFNCRHLVGQGATEYLVLLAVVLIVALVSVALLGFFPGMASDAQETQSKAYWQSASPLALVEVHARVYQPNEALSAPYFRVRNTGAYPIRITKMLGANNSISQCGNLEGTALVDMGSVSYLSPGEELNFGNAYRLNVSFQSRNFHIQSLSDSTVFGAHVLNAASTNCRNSTADPGTLVVKNFGFEYIEYVEGQQITKRQVGSKDLTIPCSGMDVVLP